ncbi:MAG TPA: T9SS C-terminal target domain-containing protein, partial [Flavobacterium sp.]
MKKLLLSIFAVSSFAANAQVTVFEDSFETYEDFAITGFGDWLTLDLDLLGTYTGGTPGADPAWANAGAPQAWQIFNPTTAMVVNDNNAACSGDDEIRNFDPHTGNKYAASWASALEGGAPVNNDFLISPVLNLGASNNVLKFWVKSMSSC